MSLQEVLCKDIPTVSPDESLRAVLQKMQKAGITHLPCVNSCGKYLGLISKGSIISSPNAAGDQESELSGFKANNHLKRDKKTFKIDTDLNAIVDILVKTGKELLVITDAKGKYAGCVTMTSVLSQFQPRQQKSQPKVMIA